MVQTIKFSQMPNEAGLIVGDELAGIREGENVTFDVSANGVYIPLPYTVVTALTQQMVPNNGYVSNNVSTVMLTLPIEFAVGSVIEVSNINGGWKILQNAGQNIIFGFEITSSGIDGLLASTALGDAVRLVGVIANTTFLVVPGSQGNITVI